MLKNTEVFGPLAGDYARYRPGYPAEVVEELVRVCGLNQNWIIADIGSGTGNSARPFLETGYQVIAVEPNREMRKAGEHLLSAYPNFRSLDGAAESIPLDDQSIDMIVVGQAIHWFDIDKTRAEFKRILRPNGWTVVMWNGRSRDEDAFIREYRDLIRRIETTHPPIFNGSISDGVDTLFGNTPLHTGNFPHIQRFDLEGFLGRARSSGFIPQPGALDHTDITALMTDLFNRHQCNGIVEFYYATRLFIGQIRD